MGVGNNAGIERIHRIAAFQVKHWTVAGEREGVNEVGTGRRIKCSAEPIRVDCGLELDFQRERRVG